jgi:carbon-monoxide dehydrogenase large subunit
VKAVLTYEDLRPLLMRDRISLALPSAYLCFDVDPYVLVKDEVTYVGEPIAMVIAENRPIAEDAAGLVVVDFDPLPAVIDVAAALGKGSPKARLDCPDNLVAHTSIRYGDPATAFDRAAHVFCEQFRLHKGGGHSLEGRAVVASFDRPADLLTVWNSTQMPHRCKTVLVDMLALSEHQVRVIAPDVGGGFGPKAVFHPEELAIPTAALLLQAPLKWIEDRRESFVATVLERDQVWSVEVAVDADGRVLGIRGQVRHDHGACTPYGLAVPYNSVSNLIGPYIVAAMDFEIFWCLTNKVPASSTRGAGRPQGKQRESLPEFRGSEEKHIRPRSCGYLLFEMVSTTEVAAADDQHRLANGGTEAPKVFRAARRAAITTHNAARYCSVAKYRAVSTRIECAAGAARRRKRAERVACAPFAV